MPARSSGKAKRGVASASRRKKPAEAQPPPRASASSAQAKSGPRVTSASAGADPVPAAKSRKGAKTAARSSATPKAASTQAARSRGAGRGGSELALLREQNDALSEELAAANARIRELEEVNATVANRIDWVIDSLQGILAAKG